MASQHSRIKQSIAELKTFFDYYRDDFEYAYRDIRPRRGWHITRRADDVYQLASVLYDSSYEALHPLLFDDSPATDGEIIDRVKHLNDYVQRQEPLFTEIAVHSDEGVLDMASGAVYELVRQLRYKLPEVLDFIKVEIATATSNAAANTAVEAVPDLRPWIGIVTATTEEFEAARAMAPQWHTIPPSQTDSSSYYEGELTRDTQTFRVVLVKTHHQGMVAAANTTTKLLARYHPVLTVMLGHAAGNKDMPHAHLGDIMIATEAVDYHQVEIVQRADTDAGATKPTIDIKDKKYPIYTNSGLKTQLEAFSKTAGLVESIVAHYPGKAAFEKPVSCRAGKFVTGGALLRSQDKFQEIMRKNPGTVALDMETQGFYYACENTAYISKPLFVAIKSLSDYGSHVKNYSKAIEPARVRQQFAAYTSAHFFYEFLFRAAWYPSD